MLADPQGHLRVMAASTERMHMLDLFEVQTSEGPCLDCYRGDAVLNVELERATMARVRSDGTLRRVPSRARWRCVCATR